MSPDQEALIKLLLTTPGHVVSHDRIARFVWDQTFWPLIDTNRLHILVCRTRKQTDFEIHNHRGQGYSVTEEGLHD